MEKGTWGEAWRGFGGPEYIQKSKVGARRAKGELKKFQMEPKDPEVEPPKEPEAPKWSPKSYKGYPQSALLTKQKFEKLISLQNTRNRCQYRTECTIIKTD